ncbi:N-acetylglutamate synthase-like GNAT family acetyltransferase [Laceyella sacchari]|uniref:GNAT family N-acetyltransferase n=1 Tax=Laceyella sacchari TaxID=37482 RepID=UPI00104E8030|nr:GNAT family N-acetyltransferase [Laceyella sacchari]TCW40426.1 N-acetylglutamate synthase-like GNAT family acetyltransferase [Laceyella sacchari]
MESVVIRRARAHEAASITELALRSKAHWGYDEAFMRQVADELTVTPEMVHGCEVVVAERAGRLLGFYILQGRPPVGELKALFVEPVAMGRQVGRMLLEHAKNVARAHGFTSLKVDSDPHAEGFYLKMGAVKIGKVPSGSIPGRFLPMLKIEV